MTRWRRCTISDVTGEALAYIRQHELLKPGARVGVAVSGGADSVAMLRVLLELRGKLGIVLSVLHFNHKIRGADADEDERFVAALAAEHNLEFHRASADVPAYAAERRMSLEAAGHEARYEFFISFLNQRRLEAVATGHTMDDQAETVLMRVLRGAGTKGLGGIHPKRAVFSCDGKQVGCVVRPLLGIRRAEARAYLASIEQCWREDASNADLQYTRNRLRHGLIPLIETRFQPSAVEALAQLAEVAREEENYWDAELGRALPGVAENGGLTVNIARLLDFPPALQRRILRHCAQSAGIVLDFAHLTQLTRAATQGDRGTICELPGGWIAVHGRSELRLERREGALPAASSYEYRLPVPGEVEIQEIGRVIHAFLRRLPCGSQGCNPEQALDPAALGRELLVRNWQPGDRLWVVHTKGPKKLKELFEQRHVPAEERRLWPVVVSEGKLAWVRGFGASAEFQPGPGAQQVVNIEEHVLHPSPSSRR